MIIPIPNRMATPSQRLPAVEAQPLLDMERVPPLICPKCGRGCHPRTLRRRGTGIGSESDCACNLCGGQFVYTPPRVRLKEIAP